MSGIDKYLIEHELEEKGWTVKDDGMKIPKSLLEKISSIDFTIYDARDLQDIIDGY